MVALGVVLSVSVGAGFFGRFDCPITARGRFDLPITARDPLEAVG